MTERARPGDAAVPPELAELAEDFEIEGEIGRGSTAVVYRARDLALERTVAIKVIRARHLADDDAVQRLEREARLVARFNHPNVVTLYAVRRLRHGSLALVMRYVQGETLRSELRRRGPLPPTRVRRLAADVARALGAAHAFGVVHRDVKPENVYVEHPTGRALLADFGAAAPLDTGARLTATGITIGTPGYLAPELVDGADATPQSDVYGLGLVAWEALTGVQPWAGETLFEVLAFRKHGHLPSLASLVPDVPPGMAHAIERALERDPDARWSGAGEMLTALVAPDPPRRGRMRSRLAGWRDAPAPPPASFGVAAPAAAAGTDLPTVAIGTARPQLAAPAFTPTSVREAAPPAPAPAPELPTAELAAAPREPVAAAAMVSDTPAGLSLDVEGERPEPPRPWRAHRLVAGAALAAVAFWALAVRGDGAPGAARSTPIVEAGADADSSIEVELERGGSAGPFVPAPPPPAPQRGQVAADQPAAPPSPPLAAPSGPLQAPTVAAVPAESPQPMLDAPSFTAPPPVVTAPLPAPLPAPTVGAGASAPRREAPAPAPAAAPARSAAFDGRTVATGGMHSCSVSRAGALFCWGGNDRGQLGVDGGRMLRASLVDAPVRVSRVALGLLHSCAIGAGDVVVCWGANDRGQLGDGTRSPRTAGDAVPGLAGVATVAVGSSHSCALLRGGRALCWGANDQGQLGIGHRADREAPSFVAGGLRFESLSAGWNHTCALQSDGQAFCWGGGGDGQLGDGGSVSRPHPVRVATDQRFRSIAAGRAHACGATSGGAVLCWGDNSAGQLGGVDRRESRSPAVVPGVSGAVRVVTGSLHSCALTARGETICWGQNRYGQLGDGTTSDRATPAPVGGAPAFVDLAASAAHTCGVTRAGDVYCWGYNLEGQLGDGTRSNRLVPVRVRSAGS